MLCCNCLYAEQCERYVDVMPMPQSGECEWWVPVVDEDDYEEVDGMVVPAWRAVELRTTEEKECVE